MYHFQHTGNNVLKVIHSKTVYHLCIKIYTDTALYLYILTPRHSHSTPNIILSRLLFFVNVVCMLLDWLPPTGRTQRNDSIQGISRHIDYISEWAYIVRRMEPYACTLCAVAFAYTCKKYFISNSCTLVCEVFNCQTTLHLNNIG